MKILHLLRYAARSRDIVQLAGGRLNAAGGIAVAARASPGRDSGLARARSEEIFDFSAEEMVSQKVKDLKNQLCGEFSQIFQLCILVLTNATKRSLLLATLNTLLRFLNWIPLGYIFETDLILILVEKVLRGPASRPGNRPALAPTRG